MNTLDKEIKAAEVQSLNSAEQLAAFFTMLGYNTNARVTQTPEALGIAAEGTIRPIRKIEMISRNGDIRPLHVFLFEVASVTTTHTRELIRAFRDKQGEFLLIITTPDYERIDFVLIERAGLSNVTTMGMSQPRIRIYPHVHTVIRRKPEAIDLRVLRRFTFTESDELAQYDKLRSAFSIAYWSEEYFNNRALFSDYFLTTRLHDFPEWKEDTKPAFVKFRDLYGGAASKWGNKPEDVLRKALFATAFEILGFRAVEGKAADSAAIEPDYRLYAPSGGDKHVALCLTYLWGRSLDGKDARDADTPDENPGAVVLSILEQGEAPFAIVTNGKYWRLYCTRAHFPAGHYYEIDLEEVLAESGTLANDPAVVFRYFWLFYRCRAFEPVEEVREGEKRATTFLDTLIDGSAEYSKKLGERLKGRVFDQIFPHFSRGFIEYIRSNGKRRAELSQADLDTVYHGTLTFLYRIFFLLYAEARDLLPVKETRGYYEKSITKLKHEIKEAAEGIFDDAPGRIEKAYSATSTALYDRLKELFAVIDSGDSALNVPVYNGGLFITAPEPDDSTPEADNARFLKENKIPDRWLALGLDLMARDMDEKTQALVFIDYKSLGVRHLGSIYEGLLEFRLRVAPEKMAIVKGKKTEEVIPYAEATKEKRKILTEGRGANATERVYQKGEVYLENDRRERKATGSYYTPDYIVKYIVEHTVGPVLEEKFKQLAPEFRKAQKAYHEAVKRRAAFVKQGMKGDDPEKTAAAFNHLVAQLFDTKALDPAMGSGHFLVEAVDFITKKIINFLNAFPWNPVNAHLRETRETILAEMEKQNVSIDAGKLTDVNLMKRHVLKQCVYGVDLNPMAVELAKVSLWLDCFTLGAPLSFLDHHLKCGNSLIGAEIDKVRADLGELGGMTHKHQLGLFGSRFAGLMLATDLMRQVGELSDVTAAQVKESRRQYRRATDALAPFKRILDVYTSQWFGNTPVKKKGKYSNEFNPAIEFLKTADAEKWTEHPDCLNQLPTENRKVASIAVEAAAAKRFFHWELEYPEVFFAPRKGTTQVIEKKPNPGFDAVIGNPPYVRQEGLGEDKSYFEIAHAPVYSGVADLYVYFYHLGLTISRNDGYFGMITSNKYLRAGYGKQIRDFLKGFLIIDIIDFHDLPLFPDAIAYPMVFIAMKRTPEKTHLVRVHKVETLLDATRIEDVMRDKAGSIYISKLNPDGWQLENPEIRKLLEKIVSAGKPLGEIINGKFYRGVLTGFNEAFVIDEEKRQELIKADPRSKEIIKPFLRGRDIKRWKVEWDGLYLIFTRRGIDINNYPAIKSHLKKFKEQLTPGTLGGRKPGQYQWYEIQDSIAYFEEFEKQKIIYPNIFNRATFAFDKEGFFCNQKTFIIPTGDLALLALLNSSLINFWCLYSLAKLQHGYLEPSAIFFQNCPIAEMKTEQKKELVSHVRAILNCANDPATTKEQEKAIDRIVFKLYGLTEEEIRIVEGK